MTQLLNHITKKIKKDKATKGLVKCLRQRKIQLPLSNNEKFFKNVPKKKKDKYMFDVAHVHVAETFFSNV